MVNELLDLTRIETGGVLLLLDDVDMGRVATGSVERLRLFAERQGVRLALDVPAVVPAVRGEEERLGQVLVNLLHNAVKFSPNGGDGHREHHRRGRRGGRPRVEDHGIGIPRRDAGPGLRALLQGRPGPRPERRRHGPGPVHRPPRRRAARRPDLGRVARRAAGRRSASRCPVGTARDGEATTLPSRVAPAGPHRCHPSARPGVHGSTARRHAQHPQPGRSLGRAAGLHPTPTWRRSSRTCSGLQEAVYVLQQDRLIGAAGRAATAPSRGWAGRPEYGNSPADPAAARRRSTRSASTWAWAGRAGRARVALPGVAAVVMAVTHLHHPQTPNADGLATSRRRQLVDWLAAAPAADAMIVVGDFNAEPREPTYARIDGGRASGPRTSRRMAGSPR